MTSVASNIESQVTGLLEALRALLNEIATERECLAQRDADLLAASTERKTLLIESVNRQTAELPAPIPELIAQATGDQRQKLEAHHSSLLELAGQARDSNAVNGKIIARSQQSARELLAMMTDSESSGIYGASGQSAGPQSVGASIKA